MEKESAFTLKTSLSYEVAGRRWVQ